MEGLAETIQPTFHLENLPTIPFLQHATALPNLSLCRLMAAVGLEEPDQSN